MTVALLLLLAAGSAVAGAWLLRHGLRRERRDAPAVIVVGVLLLVCVVTLVGIAVHVGTHPAQTRHPLERLAWPAGRVVPRAKNATLLRSTSGTGILKFMVSLSLRRPSLDGLRGVAALVVVVHHSLLIAPSLADGYRGGPSSATGSWPWLMLYSPLHLIWAGGEAVFVFFVLSGLVLALPAASGRRMKWRSYYSSRLVRLYVPIVAAVVVALVLVRLVPRHPTQASSWWLADHRSPIGLREAVHDAAVVRGTTGLNTALWSLQWEVIFSLLLPIFLLVLVRLRGLSRLKFVSLVAIAAASPHLPHSSFLLYMPMFGLGVVMAQEIGRLDRWAVAFDALRPWMKVLAVFGTGLLLISRWLLQPLPVLPGKGALGLLLTLSGVCLVVWLFGCTCAVGAFGTTAAIRWLGRRSFSLYLVHEPIVVTVAYLLGATRNAALVLVIGLPVSLLAAEVFGRVCEVPSHRLAQRVGSRFGGRSRLVAA